MELEPRGEVTVSRLWQRKSFESDIPSSLARSLNQFDLIALGLGTAIGAGIFVITGTVARDVTGPAVIISFAVAGIAMLFNALAYAEMAGRIPHSGSAFSYAYASLGEVWGWVTGWDLSLEYLLAAATEARGATHHIALIFGMLGWAFPKWLDNMVIAKGLISVDPIACVVVVLITILLCLGTKGSAIFNGIMVSISLLIMAFIIILGIPNIDAANWTPFAPFGVGSIFTGTSIVAFAFLGFDCVAATSEEAKQPKKFIPRTFVVAVCSLIVVYILTALVITGMQPYNLIDKNAPLATVFDAKGYRWATMLIAVGGIASLLTTTYGALLPQARIWFSMARDGLLPSFFGKTHEKTRVPMNSTIISGLIAAVLALLVDLSLLARLVSMGAFFVFTMVNVSVLFMRYTVPQRTTASASASVNVSSSTLLRFKVTFAVFVLCTIAAAVGLIFIPKNVYGWAIALVCLALFPLVAMFFFRPINKPLGTFTCPMVPFIPLAGIALNIYFMFNLGAYTWMRIGVWMAVGLVVYLLYGIRHSKITVGGSEYDDEIPIDDEEDAYMYEDGIAFGKKNDNDNIDETIPLTVSTASSRKTGTAPSSDLF